MPGEVLTVIHPAVTTDGYGNTVRDWDDTTETDYEGTFAPLLKRGAERKEYGAGRTTVLDNPIAYLPPHAVVEAADRIRARGVVWDINSGIDEWNHPALGAAGLVVELRKVTG